MPTDSTTTIADALRRARVLDAPQLDELTRQLQSRFPDPRALAGELIKRNWVTPYQANLLLQGRSHELLLGSYVLLERLGQGGFGQVFKARNWKLGNVVALKLIRKQRLDNPDAVRRFHREIRAAAQLDHPNIVRAIDADEVNGTHLLVMEYVQGVDLAKLVKKSGPLPADRACNYCRQAALGLQHASERGLVHRDVKPHNLLLTPSGVVKILDMGLARLDHAREEDEASSTMTREGTVMGTLDFIAPEQAMDSHTVDVRADLYSLGCTLYYLLSGRVPFPGGTAMEKLVKHQSKEPEPVERVRPGVPPAVAAVVRKLMAKRPEERYPTPAEAASALDAAGRCAANPTTQAAAPDWSSMDTPSGTTNTVAAPPRRRTAERLSPWILLGSAAGVALLALGLTVFFLMLPRPPSPPAVVVKPPVQDAEPSPQEAAEAAFEKWRQAVAALPAERQGDAVGVELTRRNPDFDGKVKATVEQGEVTALEFLTVDVTDIGPVRALPGLKRLICPGNPQEKGRLSDLSPLKGMPLTALTFYATKVSDLAPLKGMPLSWLDCGSTRVSDLTPLKGMKLTTLLCYSTRVSDLAPLKGMPLATLYCHGTPVTDLTPLQDTKLTTLFCDNTQVSDLSPLIGTPLKTLHCDCDPKRDAEILRSISTLETINGRPAADFWKAQGVAPP